MQTSYIKIAVVKSQKILESYWAEAASKFTLLSVSFVLSPKPAIIVNCSGKKWNDFENASAKVPIVPFSFEVCLKLKFYMSDGCIKSIIFSLKTKKCRNPVGSWLAEFFLSGSVQFKYLLFCSSVCCKIEIQVLWVKVKSELKCMERN